MLVSIEKQNGMKKKKTEQKYANLSITFAQWQERSQYRLVTSDTNTYVTVAIRNGASEYAN